MRPDLLHHESILFSFLGQDGVAYATTLLTMHGDVWWRGGSLFAQPELNWSSRS
jgi:hypothetical protein